MDEDHDGGDGHGDDQVLGLGKEKRENKILKANVYLRKFKKKVYLIGALCFGDQDT